MADVFKRLNLGFRHFQYVLLAMLISLDHWTVTPIMTTDIFLSDVAPDKHIERYMRFMGANSAAQIKTTSFIFFAFSRLLSAFLLLKVTNKYLLVLIVVCVISLVSVLTFLKFHLGYVGTIIIICVYQFMRAWIWPLTINILVKWMPPQEITMANALLVIPREIFSITFVFGLKNATLEQFTLMLDITLAFYCLWLVLFILFGADSPRTAYFLPTEEFHYLTKVIEPRKRLNCSAKIPFKAIFSTGIYYGWLLADFSRECMVVSIIYGLSFILKDRLMSNIYGLQAISIGFYGVVFAACWYADRLISRGKATASQVRKTFSSIGSCGTAMAMVLTAYSNEESMARSSFFVSALVFSCILSLGQPVAIIDLSPNYASVIFSILTFMRLLMFSLKNFIDTPIDHHRQNEENFVRGFYIYSFVGYLGNMIFLLCGEIKTLPFDSYDTYSWNTESVVSLQ